MTEEDYRRATEEKWTDPDFEISNMSDDRRSFTIHKKSEQNMVRTTRMPVADSPCVVRIHMEKFVGGDVDIGFVPAQHAFGGWMRGCPNCCGFYSGRSADTVAFFPFEVAEGDIFECFIDVDEGCARITKIDSEPLLTQEWRLTDVCHEAQQLYPAVSLRGVGSIVRFEVSELMTKAAR